MVKLVLPKRKIFCPIFNNLSDIKIFFLIQQVRQIRCQDQTAILCSFLSLYIGSRKCIRSDRLVRHFTTEQNTLDRSEINTFAGNNKYICRQSYMVRFVSDRPENNTSKGEKIGFQYFSSFSHNDFELLIFIRALKIGNSLAKEFLTEQQGCLLPQRSKLNP